MSSQSSLSSTASWVAAKAKAQAAGSLEPYMVPKSGVCYTPAPAAAPPSPMAQKDSPIQLTLEESFAAAQVAQYKELVRTWE